MPGAGEADSLTPIEKPSPKWPARVRGEGREGFLAFLRDSVLENQEVFSTRPDLMQLVHTDIFLTRPSFKARTC